MSLENISLNLKNLLAFYDCKNGEDVEKYRDSFVELDVLPSHNTINNLLAMKSKVPKKQTLYAIVECYNKTFSTDMTIADLEDTILPCKVEYGMKIPDIYEDFYYCYVHNLSKTRKNTKMGMFHIYIRENRYHVKALLNFHDDETLKNPKLLALLKDPDTNFEMLHALMPELPDDENYYSYFEGILELNDDFVRISLKRPDNYPLSTSRNQISIYMRRINEDMRNRLYGAVCIIISNGFDRNLNIQRMLLSNRWLPKNDEMVERLLDCDDPSIKDKDAFSWYLYVKNGEMGL